jgi:Zn-dependent protease with chaperone function
MLTGSPSPGLVQPPSAAAALCAFTAAERESFLQAIARHRRAAWRVTFVSAVADLACAVMVAALLAPLLFALAILVLDLINLVERTPDLMTPIVHAVNPLLVAPRTVHFGRWLYLGSLATLPGLALMLLVLLTLRRVLRSDAAFEARTVSARPADPHLIEQQRFANTVAEMALAAGLPSPRVLITARPVLNATVFGCDAASATIVTSEALLCGLSRSEMQGIAAHLVASIADGDMAIGQRVACSLGLFSVIGCLHGVLTDRAALRPLKGLLIATVNPGASSAHALAAFLANSDRPSQGSDPRSGQIACGKQSVQGWRAAARLPLLGLAVSALLCGMLRMFVLGPLLALAWRQRKFMADATAVRLTRDPDTLASALEKLMRATARERFAGSTEHLAVVATSGAPSGIGGGSIVPMFPAIRRRLRALTRLGAHVAIAPARLGPVFWLLILPLIVLFALLLVALMFGMVVLAALTSAGLTWVPLAFVHLLLRALAH